MNICSLHCPDAYKSAMVDVKVAGVDIVVVNDGLFVKLWEHCHEALNVVVSLIVDPLVLHEADSVVDDGNHQLPSSELPLHHIRCYQLPKRYDRNSLMACVLCNSVI